jgi:hypothetical protein
MPRKFDKGTRKSLEELRQNLDGKTDLMDKIIADAKERRS